MCLIPQALMQHFLQKATQPNIEVPPVGKAAIIAIAVPTTNTKVTITADQKPLSPAIFINDSPPSPSTL